MVLNNCQNNQSAVTMGEMEEQGEKPGAQKQVKSWEVIEMKSEWVGGPRQWEMARNSDREGGAKKRSGLRIAGRDEWPQLWGREL